MGPDTTCKRESSDDEYVEGDDSSEESADSESVSNECCVKEEEEDEMPIQQKSTQDNGGNPPCSDSMDLNIIIKQEPDDDDDEHPGEESHSNEASVNTIQTPSKMKSSVKSHPCSVCGKLFTKPSRRARHEIVHSKPKKTLFNCQYYCVSLLPAMEPVSCKQESCKQESSDEYIAEEVHSIEVSIDNDPEPSKPKSTKGHPCPVCECYPPNTAIIERSNEEVPYLAAYLRFLNSGS
ncbi:hypothetical protein WMY93_006325 [Mugilogobius chulae]|uniref:C2H2-type domain-containing protein n=1 Tax=Mugilogobius chulae TaxID=88201 RepID=A0AAW0PJN8_9GOBI